MEDRIPELRYNKKQKIFRTNECHGEFHSEINKTIENHNDVVK